MIAFDGILQRGSQRRLTYDGVECRGTIFACRNNEIIHEKILFSAFECKYTEN